MVLIVRPFILPRSAAETIDEKLYVLFTEYLATPAAFAVGFGILIKSLQTVLTGDKQGQAESEFAIQNTDITATAVFCGIIGVLIHNLIDFAILEPGVLVTFFACLGCLMAMSTKIAGQRVISGKVSGWLTAGGMAVVLIFCYAYLRYAVVPVERSMAKISESRKFIIEGQYNVVHNLLGQATQEDKLSPEAAAMNGRLYLQQFYWPFSDKEETLKEAENAFFVAAARNPEDYKNYELLGEVYSLRAKESPVRKDKWLNDALAAQTRAAELYPGNPEVRYELAETAEGLGQKETALKQYEEAIRIEDAFREQFTVMYPGWKVFSRLGEEKYDIAKDRVKELMGE
jgi:hypothetical protein